MSKLYNPPPTKEEFRVLFQHNLLDKLKVYSNITPLRAHNNGKGYDSADIIKNKMQSIFVIDKNTPLSPYDYKINISIPETSIENLAELEKFTNDLNKKISNHKLGLIAGESLDATTNRFLLRIQNFMDKKELGNYAAEVVSVIGELAKIAQLSEKEKEYYFKSLANGKTTKQKFYDILSYTCEEFKFQITNPPNEEEACYCPSEVADDSPRYSRKSVALMTAKEDITIYQNRSALALSLGKCNTDKKTWHYWMQIV